MPIYFVNRQSFTSICISNASYLNQASFGQRPVMQKGGSHSSKGPDQRVSSLMWLSIPAAVSSPNLPSGFLESFALVGKWPAAYDLNVRTGQARLELSLALAADSDAS